MPRHAAPLYGRPLKDVRLERFCQEVAKGAAPNVAAANAGFNFDQASYGEQVMQRPHVQDRVDEIRREMEEFLHPEKKDIEGMTLDAITPDWVLSQALETYLTAKAQRNVSVMVKMLDLIGRLKGIDKRPVGRPRVNKNPNNGEEKDESKPRPENPLDFAALVKAAGDLRVGTGDSDEEEDSSDGVDDPDEELEEEA